MAFGKRRGGRHRTISGDRKTALGAKVIGLYAVLAAANLCAWGWAFAAFRGNAVLLGTALLVYGLGLRHAVDADHIAAIDNVTRKLMQDGERPISVGFFFALGHSTVVVLAVLALALTAGTLERRLPDLVAVGGVVGTLISALFLFAIAAINLVVLASIYRLFRRVAGGGSYEEAELQTFLVQRGLLGRLFRRLFRLIEHSWQMYPLGFLFGLGFDTASEVALLGISASAAVKGLSVWSVMVFPALFTAGMSLVDTTDGVLMLGAYGWAFVNPMRKLYYNLTITAVSVVVALAVGGIEVAGLIAQQFGLAGGAWDAVTALSDNFGMLGYLVIALFIAAWLGSFVFYRIRGYDKIATARKTGSF